MISEKMLLRLMPWMVTVGLFLIWEVGCRLTGVAEFVLPRPTVVWEATVKFREQILHHSLQTLYTTTAGFIRSISPGRQRPGPWAALSEWAPSSCGPGLRGAARARPTSPGR